MLAMYAQLFTTRDPQQRVRQVQGLCSSKLVRTARVCTIDQRYAPPPAGEQLPHWSDVQGGEMV